MVFYSQLMTHRLPDLYPNPDHFLPERLASIRPPIYEYLPFVAGTHMCIGAGFATQEMKVVLATLVQRYRLELAPNHKLDVSLGMQPTTQMPVTLYRQDCHFAKGRVRGKIRDLLPRISAIR